MTIDETILKCNEVAKNNEESMKRYDDASGYTRSHNESIRTIDAKKCEIRARKYKQLAEWLKQLQEIQKIIKSWKDGTIEEKDSVYAFHKIMKVVEE